MEHAWPRAGGNGSLLVASATVCALAARATAEGAERRGYSTRAIALLEAAKGTAYFERAENPVEVTLEAVYPPASGFAKTAGLNIAAGLST